jgi:hypothetical protein
VLPSVYPGFFAFESVKSVANFFAHVHDVGLKLIALDRSPIGKCFRRLFFLTEEKCQAFRIGSSRSKRYSRCRRTPSGRTGRGQKTYSELTVEQEDRPV